MAANLYFAQIEDLMFEVGCVLDLTVFYDHGVNSLTIHVLCSIAFYVALQWRTQSRGRKNT